jgi:hypothetical protein
MVFYDVEDEDNHMRAALAYVTGLVNQELLLQNEYLWPAESRSAANSQLRNVA